MRCSRLLAVTSKEGTTPNAEGQLEQGRCEYKHALHTGQDTRRGEYCHQYEEVLKQYTLFNLGTERMNQPEAKQWARLTWVQAEESRECQPCRWDSSLSGRPTYRLVASAREKPVLMVQWYTAPCTTTAMQSLCYGPLLMSLVELRLNGVVFPAVLPFYS